MSGLSPSVPSRRGQTVLLGGTLRAGPGTSHPATSPFGQPPAQVTGVCFVMLERMRAAITPPAARTSSSANAGER